MKSTNNGGDHPDAQPLAFTLVLLRQKSGPHPLGHHAKVQGRTGNRLDVARPEEQAHHPQRGQQLAGVGGCEQDDLREN
jgi:hypothetical protein